MSRDEEQSDDSIFDQATVGHVVRLVGPYEIVRLLGRGGMGEVHLARHTHLKRLVALKLIRDSRLTDPQSIVRFYREMEAIGALTHPNLVLATDAGCVDDIHFLAMEWIDGITLSDLVRDHGPVTPDVACEIIRQTAVGLDHAHQQGVIHRDVKPSNVMLGRDGVVKLLDLGLARVAPTDAPAALTELTLDSQMMGTPDFMAPEQARDSRRATARSDIYSLGCTFFTLLSGRAPFDDAEHDTAVKKIMAHQQDPFPSLESQSPPFSDSLLDTLARMTAREPAERIATAAVVAERLRPLSNADALQSLLQQTLPAPESIDSRSRNTDQAHGLSLTKDHPRPVSAEANAGSRRAAVWCLGVVTCAALLTWGVLAWQSESRTGGQSDAERVGGVASTEDATQNAEAETIAVEQFDILHHRFTQDDAVRLGVVGAHDEKVRLEDDLRARIRFNTPVHAFVYAINTDGSIQLCWPSSPQQPPSAATEIEVYPESDLYLHLAEGVGRQALIVVASENPLPAWDQWWEAGQQVTPLADAVGVWRFQQGRLQAQYSGAPDVRAERRRGPADFRAHCMRLAADSEIDLIEGLTFSVHPKN